VRAAAMADEEDAGRHILPGAICDVIRVGTDEVFEGGEHVSGMRRVVKFVTSSRLRTDSRREAVVHRSNCVPRQTGSELLREVRVSCLVPTSPRSAMDENDERVQVRIAVERVCQERLVRAGTVI